MKMFIRHKLLSLYAEMMSNIQFPAICDEDPFKIFIVPMKQVNEIGIEFTIKPEDLKTFNREG